MKKIKGDLIQLAKNGEFDIIIHGCNCFNTMGAGIAYQIAKHFPHAEDADMRTVQGDMGKLGKYSYAIEFFDDGSGSLIVINAYTQYTMAKSKDDVAVDYDAVRSVFKSIAELCAHSTNVRIGYPMIGAGLANGDWNVISSIIDEELDGLDHTLVVYDGSK